MSQLDEVQREIERFSDTYRGLLQKIGSLTGDERKQALSDLYSELRAVDPRLSSAESPPGIDRSADVCGGSARIVRTRIPVWTLVQMRRLGLPNSELLASFPSLRAEDLFHAWGYADLHPEEIDAEIRENEE